MSRFRKKPVVIEAIWLSRASITKSKNGLVGPFGLPVITDHDKICVMIDTLEGTMVANEGDWIIKGVAGELYPCRDEIFRKTYEEVGDNDAGNS